MNAKTAKLLAAFISMQAEERQNAIKAQLNWGVAAHFIVPISHIPGEIKKVLSGILTQNVATLDDGKRVRVVVAGSPQGLLVTLWKI